MIDAAACVLVEPRNVGEPHPQQAGSECEVSGMTRGEVRRIGERHQKIGSSNLWCCHLGHLGLPPYTCRQVYPRSLDNISLPLTPKLAKRKRTECRSLARPGTALAASACGRVWPKAAVAAMQQFGRFRGEADIIVRPAEPDLPVRALIEDLMQIRA